MDEKKEHWIEHDGISHAVSTDPVSAELTISTPPPEEPKEIDTEEGREAMVLRRAEDLCRRGKAPKHCWPGIFDQHLEEYHYFIKYGNTNDK